MAFDNSETNFLAALTATELNQVLREVTLGGRAMARAGNQTWNEVYACHFVVDIDRGALPFTTISMSSTIARYA